ncbi:MAG: PilZ domain-containing protein [Phycisphaeraceae bacterium]
MSDSILRLVDDAREAGEPFVFDRRRAARRRLSNDVTALLVDGYGPDHTGPRILPMETRNISDSGVGAVCDFPLPLRAEVRLFFPPHGSDPGFELRGWVARCVPAHGRYDIGLTFGRQSASAA